MCTKARMGRRKSKRKPEARKKNIEALDTQFTCPFCNHEKSCEVWSSSALLLYTHFNYYKFTIFEVKMDKSKHAAKIQCTVCLEDFQVTFELTLCLLLNPGPGAVLTSLQFRPPSTSCQSQWTCTMNGSTLARPSTTEPCALSLKISNLWSSVCDVLISTTMIVIIKMNGTKKFIQLPNQFGSVFNVHLVYLGIFGTRQEC